MYSLQFVLLNYKNHSDTLKMMTDVKVAIKVDLLDFRLYADKYLDYVKSFLSTTNFKSVCMLSFLFEERFSLNTKFMRTIAKTSKRVKESLSLCNAIITTKKFIQILHLFSHLPLIRFSYCVFLFIEDDMKISKSAKFDINQINFDGLGIKEEMLEAFLECVKQNSSFKQSLKTIRYNSYQSVNAGLQKEYIEDLDLHIERR